jgi:predicted nucleotidyltransferase
MTSEEILDLLKLVGKKLQKQNIHGEVVICGGAVMCMQYNARDNTDDIDGLYEPKTEMNEIIRQVADERNLDLKWFNNDVHHTINDFYKFRQTSVFFKKFGGLYIYTVKLEQMIAMKLYAFRTVEWKHDIDDLNFLINKLRQDTEVTSDLLMLFCKDYGVADKLKQSAIDFIDNIERVDRNVQDS